MRITVLFVALSLSACTLMAGTNGFDRLVTWEEPTEDVNGDRISGSLIAYEIYSVEVDHEGNVVRDIERLKVVDAPATSTLVHFRSLPIHISMKAVTADGVSEFSDAKTYYY